MEKNLSHQIDVDVEILLRGVDLVMPQHLFDLINGPDPGGEDFGHRCGAERRRRKEPCLFHRFGDALITL